MPKPTRRRIPKDVFTKFLQDLGLCWQKMAVHSTPSQQMFTAYELKHEFKQRHVGEWPRLVKERWPGTSIQILPQYVRFVIPRMPKLDL